MRRAAVLILAAALAAPGCSTIRHDEARADAGDVEHQLEIAGFQIVPADSPERIESMHALPALSFARTLRGGRQYFVYADPVNCLCVYVGTPAAFARFQELGTASGIGVVERAVQEVDLDEEIWGPDWSTASDPEAP